MKTMKTFSRRIAALLLVVTVGITALAPAASASSIQLPSLPKDQCVVDDAGVLSDSTTSELETLNAQLSSSCDGAQIGVLTVDYTGSATTEDYATEAFNTWGIGSSSKNNGVLILLVMQSDQYADGDYYLTYGDGFRSTMLADLRQAPSCRPWRTISPPRSTTQPSSPARGQYHRRGVRSHSERRDHLFRRL